MFYSHAADTELKELTAMLCYYILLELHDINVNFSLLV